MVILTHPIIGDREFGDEHARRLMALPKNGGWKFKQEPTKKADDVNGDGDTKATKRRGHKSRPS